MAATKQTAKKNAGRASTSKRTTKAKANVDTSSKFVRALALIFTIVSFAFLISAYWRYGLGL